MDILGQPAHLARCGTLHTLGKQDVMKIRAAPFGSYLLLDPSEYPGSSSFKALAMRAQIVGLQHGLKTNIVVFSIRDQLRVALAAFNSELDEPRIERVRLMYENHERVMSFRAKNLEEIFEALTSEKTGHEKS